MRSINPKCANNKSFKYSILISLYYYELKHHPERIKRLNKQTRKYNFTTTTYKDFENNNSSISLTSYDEYGQLLHKSNNQKNNKASIVKINSHRYHAIKANKDKYTHLKILLKQFTHKELTNIIVNKIIQ